MVRPVGGLVRVALGYLRRKPWTAGLMVLGIALGVAVAVAVDIANTSALRAFEYSNAAVTGRATHQVVAGSAGLDERVYVDLRLSGALEGGASAAPVVSEMVSSPILGGQPLKLLGVDPFAEPPFRPYLGPEGLVSVESWGRLLTEPGAVLISEGMADRYGIKAGDDLPLDVGGYQRGARLVGLVSPRDEWSRRALDEIILTDIASAQEMMGKLGRIDAIDLILPDHFNGLARLQAELPPEAEIVPVASRSQAVRDMSAAFRLNLIALSLLALVVGCFLIYNTMTFSVIQRRTVFGILRSMGVTRQEILGIVLGEAAVVGAVGGALGVALGIVLGTGAVRLVARTINDLYFVVAVTNVDMAGGSLLRGFLLGLLASVAVAVPPAWEAATAAPRAALSRAELEGKAGRSATRGAFAGLGLGLLSAILLASPLDSLPVSFAGTLASVLAFALLTPVAARALMRVFSPWLERLVGPLGRMAPRGVVNALSRTGVAVAALMVAISVSIGVSLMVGSFRHTVEVWLGQVLTGDIYISAPGVSPVDTDAPIDPAAVDFVETQPWIERVDELRTVTVRGESGPVELLAIDDPDFGSRPFRWTVEGPDRIWGQLQSGAVAVSEPFANRIGLTVGDAALELRTPEGRRSFRVVGIYSDYGSSQGTVAMSMSVYRRVWRDDTVSGLALRLAPDEDVDSRANWLADQLPHIQGLLVRPTRALREEALRIFERTFAITRALQLLAVLVAFIGVLSALLSMELEKQREFGLLRAIGLTSRGLGALITMETGLMGAVAGLLAMPTGLALALILIHIINRRFFGWTLQTQIAFAPFAIALLIGVSAAVLAGVYPSARLREMPPGEALRYE
jgi:putative ABC transport system permease protein